MRAPWKTEVRTTKSDAKLRKDLGWETPKQRATRQNTSRRNSIRRIRQRGRVAEWKTRMRKWRGLRARGKKRHTLVGGFREIMYVFAGLSVATSILSYMFSWPGGFTGGLVGAGTSGTVLYGQKVWKDKKGGRRVPRRHQAAVVNGFQQLRDRNIARQRAATAAQPSAQNQQDPRSNKSGQGRPCSGSCRRSTKPKSTCRCKANPCYHGTEAA